MGSQGNTLVWLITGAGSGLGYQLALEALSRSDKVIVTGRSGRAFEKLKELKETGAEILELDVTASLESLQETAKKAIDIYGRVDVVVNNAAFLVSGVLEEISPQATQEVFNTNLFGALNVMKVFLPYMRNNRAGTVVWIGSIAGRIGFPCGGSYVGTKWALRGISATLQMELSSLGLRSICVDLGWFRTCLADPSYRVKTASDVEDYKVLADAIEARLQAYNGTQPGDPVKGARVLVDVVRGEGAAKDKPFPPELVLGTDCYDTVKADLLRNLELLEAWKDVSKSTDFEA